MIRYDSQMATEVIHDGQGWSRSVLGVFWRESETFSEPYSLEQGRSQITKFVRETIESNSKSCFFFPEIHKSIDTNFKESQMKNILLLFLPSDVVVRFFQWAEFSVDDSAFRSKI